MTLNEYKEKHKLSNKDLAKLIGLTGKNPIVSVIRYLTNWNNFHQLRLYARGEQSVQKYKLIVTGFQNPDQRAKLFAKKTTLKEEQN